MKTKPPRALYGALLLGHMAVPTFAQFTNAELQLAGHVARRTCSGAGLAEISQLLPGGGSTQLTNIISFLQVQTNPAGISENSETTNLLGLYSIPTAIGASDPSHPQFVPQGSSTWSIEDLADTNIIRAVWSEKKLCEVMTRFWQEHFTTNWGALFGYFRTEFGKPVYALPPYNFTTQAIRDAKAREYAAYMEWAQNDRFRKNCLGTFEDLLVASGMGEAMMIYLDTEGSEAPSPNENYARELMELHTLGLESPFPTAGGSVMMRNYVYQDIVTAAAVFSGWTLVDSDLALPTPTGVPNFQFQFTPTTCPAMGSATSGHLSQCPAPGTKTLYTNPQVNPLVSFPTVGVTLSEDPSTPSEGTLLLSRLANSPATAWSVSKKLYKLFITEVEPDPFDPVLLDCINAWFTLPGGNIQAVVQTLLTSNQFLNDPTIRFNLERQPVGWVAHTASLFHARGFDAAPAGLMLQPEIDQYNRDRIGHLRFLVEEYGGQQLFRYGPPDGFERGDGQLLTTYRMLGSIRFRQELYDFFDLTTYPWHRDSSTPWPGNTSVPSPGLGFDYLNALAGGVNFADETSLTNWFTLICFQNAQTSGDWNSVFLFWLSDLGGLLGTPLALAGSLPVLLDRMTSGLTFVASHTLNNLK